MHKLEVTINVKAMVDWRVNVGKCKVIKTENRTAHDSLTDCSGYGGRKQKWTVKW